MKNTKNKERYKDLLNHPKWQKRRLEIMQSHDFKCQICKDDEETLHIHHIKYKNCWYRKDTPADPWDYADQEMQCLCETCHSLAHMDSKKIRLSAELNAEKIAQCHKVYGAFNDHKKHNIAKLSEQEYVEYNKLIMAVVAAESAIFHYCKERIIDDSKQTTTP